jgi:hypothetical protein
MYSAISAMFDCESSAQVGNTGLFHHLELVPELTAQFQLLEAHTNFI